MANQVYQTNIRPAEQKQDWSDPTQLLKGLLSGNFGLLGQLQNNFSNSSASDLMGGNLNSLMSILKESGIKDMFMGSPQRNEQLDTKTQKQKDVMDWMLQQGQQGLSNNNFNFEPIRQRAERDFTQRDIPSIAERFSSLGAQNSGAFQRTLGQAQSGLRENLAAMEQDYNLKRQQLLQNLLGMGLDPQFENIIHKRDPGLIENAATALAGGFGSALGSLGMGSLTGMFKPGNMGSTASQFGSDWNPANSYRNTSFQLGNRPQLGLIRGAY